MNVISELVEGIADGGEVGHVRTDLLDHGRAVIAGLRMTIGEGEPELGEAFGHAREAFDGVSVALKGAVPVGWEGLGSYAYTDQNARQQMRSEAMADADREVQEVLGRQAAQISAGRAELDAQDSLLAGAGQLMHPLQSVPQYGTAMKLAVEMGALQSALGESCRQTTQLVSEVAQNAAELLQAVGRYAGVADGAQLRDPAPDFAAATTVGASNPGG